MDIEELINNINDYDEITKSFYNNYLQNKNITFDKLLKDTFPVKSTKRVKNNKNLFSFL